MISKEMYIRKATTKPRLKMNICFTEKCHTIPAVKIIYLSSNMLLM